MIIKIQQINLLFQIHQQKTNINKQMRNQNLFSKTTLSNYITPLRNERGRRFARKPSQGSQRSLSRKSFDADSVKQTYLKSPSGTQKSKNKHEDFFASLASSIMKKSQVYTDKKPDLDKYKGQPTDRTNLTQFQNNNQDIRVHFDSERTITNLHNKIQTLQAQLDLRNHQTSILQGERQRLKKTVEQQKQRRRKLQIQKKEVSRQLKQIQKIQQNLKAEMKKIQKQRQCLLKQIQFLQRINFDDKTRSLQSYRQTYLSQQLQRIRKQYHKSRGQRQQQLQYQIKVIKQQKYTIQSHLKATKLANECLVKQMSSIHQNVQEFVQNSEEYKRLRDKYIKFLQQYKLLRKQYWTLKAQKQAAHKDQSEILSFSMSEVQNDLSVLKSINSGNEENINNKSKNQNSSILQFLTPPTNNHNALSKHLMPPKPKNKQQMSYIM